jgi:Protein of unknown function (DUF2905)
VRDLGRLLSLFGLAMLVVGALLWLAPDLPWLGRLPGDIHIERPGLRIVVPLGTCLLLSIVLSLLVALFRGRP